MTHVLVTGATGFLGSALLKYLPEKKIQVVGSTRREINEPPLISVGELSEITDWSEVLQDIDVVIHCAGIAHDKSTVASSFNQVNVLATQRLLEQCIIANVKQFIFISSVGVNGNITTDEAFRADDKPNPMNAYAKSKADAEQCIIKYLLEQKISYTIIRPPLIYGRNAPGNFGMLMRIIDKNIPLPLAGVNNRRSLVGLRNLTSLIGCCILNETAYNQIFLVSDSNDISTNDLLKKMGKLSGKSVFLFPFPKVMIKRVARLLKREAAYQGLFESLQVDISETCNKLGWQPPYTLEQELAQCFGEKVD